MRRRSTAFLALNISAANATSEVRSLYRLPKFDADALELAFGILKSLLWKFKPFSSV